LQTEEKTISHTLKLRDEDSIEINNLIDIFFRLSYHCRENVIPESNEAHFISLANLTYIRIPYSLRAIYSLWIRGYYLDALVLFRSMLESLITLRYFHKHIDKIQKHLGVSLPKKRVHFNTMFDEISPGFYEDFYGNIYSQLAHSGILAGSFRLKGSFAEGEFVMGCEFNPERSNLVTVSTILISYGYFNYISVFFPYITSKISSTMKNRIQDISEHIENKYLKQSDNIFLKTIIPIICKYREN
jgi:hypothetical protein